MHNGIPVGKLSAKARQNALNIIKLYMTTGAQPNEEKYQILLNKCKQSCGGYKKVKTAADLEIHEHMEHDFHV